MKTFLIAVALFAMTMPAFAQDMASLRVTMAVETVDEYTGERSPTGHQMTFTSAPGSIEQMMIEWYAYMQKLICCEEEDGESLEDVATRIMQLDQGRRR